MSSLNPQAAKTLVAFFEDFGTSSGVVRSAARRMKISESVAMEAATAYETAKGQALDQTGGRNPIRERQIRESAELLVERANRAEADLRHASLQDLEALAAVSFGR